MKYWMKRQGGLCVAAVALLADVMSKGLVLNAVMAGKMPVWWVEGQLGLVFAWNRGMSFSLLQDSSYGPWFLGGVAVLACGWFVHWLGEGKIWGVHQVGLGLVIGGAMGNLIDRVQHGAVVDFAVVSPGGFFPYTFNVADACITVGVGLLLLDGFLNKKG